MDRGDTGSNGTEKMGLQGDINLLQQLESFSQSIFSRAGKILGQYDDTESLLSSTYIEVRAISNAFHILADSQFFMNYVRDDDCLHKEADRRKDDCLNKETEKRDSSRLQDSEAQAITQEEAIEHCLKAVNDHFHRSEVHLESPESGELESFTVLVPKEKYDRPLPHLIGSKSFWEDDTLGLYTPCGTQSGVTNATEGQGELSSMRKFATKNNENPVKNRAVCVNSSDSTRSDRKDGHSYTSSCELDPLPSRIEEISLTKQNVNKSTHQFQENLLGNSNSDRCTEDDLIDKSDCTNALSISNELHSDNVNKFNNSDERQCDIPIPEESKIKIQKSNISNSAIYFESGIQLSTPNCTVSSGDKGKTSATNIFDECASEIFAVPEDVENPFFEPTNESDDFESIFSSSSYSFNRGFLAPSDDSIFSDDDSVNLFL